MARPVRVAYLLRSWPRLSQTFVLHEVLEVERSGVEVAILSMSKSGEELVQPEVRDVRAPVRFLDEARGRVGAHGRAFARGPRRYLATLLHALRCRDLYGGYTKSSPWRAFDAAVWATGTMHALEKGRPFTHIHAHFAHDPALIGLLAHRLTGLPFSFTAHARDLYQIPRRALRARAAEATAVVTCCRANVDHIRAAVPATTPVELIYHGVDLRRFAPGDGAARGGEPMILSVGRLVEKKGIEDLLAACAVVAGTGRPFRCEVYGDGPQRASLLALREQLGLRRQVEFRGACTQSELIPLYQRAAVFALTPRVLDDGDRDGVPNVLLEAMACATPVVTTRAGGIAEVVEDGRNGLLVEPRDSGAIGAALLSLLEDGSLRTRLGAGAADTAGRFDVRVGAARLAALFAGPGSL